MFKSLDPSIWEARVSMIKSQRRPNNWHPTRVEGSDMAARDSKETKEEGKPKGISSNNVSESHTPAQTEMHRGISLNAEETPVEAIHDERQESTSRSD